MSVVVQRLLHMGHFADSSKNFYKIFGLFEIIIKLLTLCFFLATLFYFWKSDRTLRNLNVRVRRSSEYEWDKYWLASYWIQNSKNYLHLFRFLSIVRKTILGFLLFGSLIFNIFTYFTTDYNFGVKLCEKDLVMFVENLLFTFEILKRLNGVYILIFHFTQARFKGLLKKKFENCCKKTPRRKTKQRRCHVKTIETKVWINILYRTQVGNWFLSNTLVALSLGFL